MKRAYLSVSLSLMALCVCVFSIAMMGAPATADIGDDNSSTFTIDFGDYGIVFQKQNGYDVCAIGYTGTPVNVDLPSQVEYDGNTYMVASMSSTFLKCKTLETFRGGYGQDWLDVDIFVFYECTSLRTVEFGPSIRYIHYYALLECTSLESYSMPEGSIWNYYSVDDGVLMINETMMESGPAIFKYPANKATKEYHVPDYVKTILANSFDYAFNLEKVILNEGVEKIEAGAFHGCVALEAFEIDGDNPNFEVLDGVLYMEGLEELLCYPAGRTARVFDMPDSVMIILDYAFFRNVHLVEVLFSSNLKAVGFEAFNSAQSLKRVVLPEGTMSIGENCFTLATNLRYVSLPSTMEVIGAYLFRGCTSLSVVQNASDLPLSSMHFVESKRTFYYYQDSLHMEQHDDPQEMYGDIYVLRSLPDDSQSYTITASVVIAVVAIILIVSMLVRVKN